MKVYVLITISEFSTHFHGVFLTSEQARSRADFKRLVGWTILERELE